jgi:chromosome segregation ATPase
MKADLTIAQRESLFLKQTQINRLQSKLNTLEREKEFLHHHCKIEEEQQTKQSDKEDTLHNIISSELISNDPQFNQKLKLIREQEQELKYLENQLAELKQIKSRLNAQQRDLSDMKPPLNLKTVSQTTLNDCEHDELVTSLDRMSAELETLELKQHALFKSPEVSVIETENDVSVESLINRLMDASVEDLEAGLAKTVPCVENQQPENDTQIETLEKDDDDGAIDNSEISNKKGDDDDGAIDNSEINNTIQIAWSKIESTKKVYFHNKIANCKST